MSFSRKTLGLSACLALSFGFFACDDHKPKIDPELLVGLDNACKGSDCISENIEQAKPKLTECKMSEASALYEAAWAKQVHDDARSADLALKRSVTGLLNLTQHPVIKELLPKFGFTNPAQLDCLWGSSGLLEMMGKSSCTDEYVDNFCKDLSNEFFHGDKDFSETIDPSLTFGGVSAKLLGINNRLISLSQSFEFAAESNTNNLVNIAEGSCGLNDLKFSKSDLYAIASLLKIAAASIELSSMYSNEFNLKEFVDFMTADSEEEVGANRYCSFAKKFYDGLNKYLLVLNKGASASNGKELLMQGLSLFVKALDSVTSGSSGNGIIAWNNFSTSTRAEMKELANLILTADKDNKPIDLTKFTRPAFTIDLNKYFANPVSRTASDTIFTYACECVVGYNEDYCYAEDNTTSSWDWAFKYLNDVLSIKIFSTNNSGDVEIKQIDWKASASWESIDAEAVSDPNNKFDNLFTCMEGE